MRGGLGPPRCLRRGEAQGPLPADGVGASFVVTGGGLHPDEDPLVELRDRPGTGVGEGLRTPATIMSTRSSTPGLIGSRYILEDEMPSSKRAERARSNEDCSSEWVRSYDGADSPRNFTALEPSRLFGEALYNV